MAGLSVGIAVGGGRALGPLLEFDCFELRVKCTTGNNINDVNRKFL